MSFLAALPVIGDVVKGITGVIDKSVTDKDLANKLKHDIETQALQLDYSALEKEIEARAQVITAEAKGGWLQRNWRPILMLTFTYIVAHNYIIAPIFGLVNLDLPPDMWTLLKIGVGGYIVGRSGEKIAVSMKK